MIALGRTEQAVGDEIEAPTATSECEAGSDAEPLRSTSASLRFSTAEIELLRHEFEASVRWRDVLVGNDEAIDPP